MSNKKFCSLCYHNGYKPEVYDSHFPGSNCSVLTSLVCNKCGLQGHNQSQCRSPQCNFCKIYGHKINNCEKLKEKIEKDKEKYCSFCGENGHTNSRCDNPYNARNINNHKKY